MSCATRCIIGLLAAAALVCAGAGNAGAFVRDSWVPLFEQHGVDLVVSGHATR